jgi:hypothetical protein
VHRGTALCAAAYRGDVAVIRRLLGGGADPNLADGDHPDGDFTPLLNAVYAGHLEAARVLLDAGANPRARGPGRQRLLDYAKRGAKEGHKKDRPWDEILAFVRETAAGGPPTVGLELLVEIPLLITELRLSRTAWRHTRVGALDVFESSELAKLRADWEAVQAIAARHGYFAVLAGWSLDDVEPEVTAAEQAVAAVDAEAGRQWLASANTAPDDLRVFTTASIQRSAARPRLKTKRSRLVLASGAPERVAALYEMAVEDLEPVLLASVLAAWREDLGAQLAGFGHATAEVILPEAIADEGEVRRRALELLAFCVDLGEFPRELLSMTASRQWSFWWD